LFIKNNTIKQILLLKYLISSKVKFAKLALRFSKPTKTIPSCSTIFYSISFSCFESKPTTPIVSPLKIFNLYSLSNGKNLS
jgi:hypothetical protein